MRVERRRGVMFKLIRCITILVHNPKSSLYPAPLPCRASGTTTCWLRYFVEEESIGHELREKQIRRQQARR